MLPHAIEVRATDAAGNAGTASYSWTIDTVPPAATIGAHDSVEGQDSEQQLHSREKGQSSPQLVIRFAG